MPDIFEDMVVKISVELARQEEAELIKWLDVESQERAVQVLERLQELGLTVERKRSEPKVETLGDGLDKYTIQVDQEVTFKLIPLQA